MKWDLDVCWGCGDMVWYYRTKGGGAVKWLACVRRDFSPSSPGASEYTVCGGADCSRPYGDNEVRSFCTQGRVEVPEQCPRAERHAVLESLRRL